MNRGMASVARRRVALSLMLAATMSSAVVAAAADIVVMTSGTFTAAYESLSAAYARTTGDRFVTATTTMGVGAESIPNRLAAGQAADIIIVAADNLDDLIRQGRVVPGSRVDLARSSIALAVKHGAPAPDISSVEALIQALLSTRSVAYSASVSGDYLVQELFPKLGIADAMRRKSQRIERERVGEVVARGDAEIGFQQLSELRPVPGIDIVGLLPPAVQKVTVVSAGIARNAAHPDSARAFLTFLMSAAAQPVIEQTGLEPIR
jgi:molybdate transport system substrate-binding protein